MGSHYQGYAFLDTSNIASIYVETGGLVWAKKEGKPVFMAPGCTNADDWTTWKGQATNAETSMVPDRKGFAKVDTRGIRCVYMNMGTHVVKGNLASMEYKIVGAGLKKWTKVELNPEALEEYRRLRLRAALHKAKNAAKFQTHAAGKRCKL